MNIDVPIQSCELVDRRWDALLDGEKLSTIRLNEGDFTTGFLLYYNSSKTDRAVVWVNDVADLVLEEVAQREGGHQSADELLTTMKRHYPEIILETKVKFVEHLSVEQTRQQYPDEVAKILAANQEV